MEQLATDTNNGTPTQFNFKNAAGNKLLSLDSSGNATIAGTLTTNAGNFDVAEDYPTKDHSIEAGDIVAVDKDNAGHVQKSNGVYDKTVLGVYSEKPGFRLSENGGAFGTDTAVPVALAGRVPVKVTTENGPIHKGDYLTSSSTPGIAMKATRPGQVLGKALEDFNCGITSPIGSCGGKVMAFVNVTFADPEDTLANLAIDDHGNVMMSNVSTTDVKLSSDLQINGQVVNGSLSSALTAVSTNLSQTSTSLNAVQTTLASVASTAATLTDKVATLQDQQASLSAQVSDTTNRVVSTASGLDSLTRRVNDLFTSLTNSVTATTPAAMQIPDLAPFIASTAAQLGLDNLTATTATIGGTLNVLGRTTITDLGVTGHISAGVLSINGLDDDGNATINALGVLKLQDHGLGNLDIMTGKVVIDTNGNVTIKNNLTAQTVTTQKLNITTDSSDVLSASAGVASVKAGTSSITIKTTAVTANSLIYVTFSGDYSPAVRYWIANKTAKSGFTLKLDAQVYNDAKFNWWIVN